MATVKRLLGPLLTILLLGGVGVALYLSIGEQAAERRLIEVRGLIGSEKEALFRDERVRSVLRRQHGLEVHAEKAGSRQIATAYDLANYDFAFPAGVPAAEKIRQEVPSKPQSYNPFYTPMAVASWRPIAEILVANGIAERRDDHYYIIDMARLLQLIAEGRRWNELAASEAYAVNRSILVNSTDVRKSNSAAMYLALMSYIVNDNRIVSSEEGIRRVLPQAAQAFLRQGFVEYSSEAPFEDYLVMGIGKAPLVMIYESQFIHRALLKDGSIRDDMVIMYPRPTIFSKHVLVGLTEGGARLGDALENDPELQRLAVEHGFRNNNVTYFSELMERNRVPVADAILDVIEPPRYEIIERMIQLIEEQYR